MNAIMALTGGRAPPSQIRRRLSQDLIGLAQVAPLSFQGLDPLTVIAGWTSPQPLVALRLAHPAAQRLPCAANLRRNRADRRPLGGVIRHMLQHHSHRPQRYLSRIAV